MPLDPSVLKNLKALHRARKGEDYWAWTYPEWSDAQMRFLQSDKKKLLLRAARRSGKTTVIAERMLKVVNSPVKLQDGSTLYGAYVYITQTRELAKSIMWKELKEMCNRRGLTFTSNEVDLKMTFPHGGSIELQGAGLQDSANKARGRKMVGVAIDEAAFIAPLKEIVEIWTPTLADYEGELVLSCSPGKTPTGYFYECDMGSMKEFWKRFYLIPEENPIFKNGKYEEFRAEQLRTLYGGNEQHPVYRREWLGEWVKDSSALLIKYDHTVNDLKEEHQINHDNFEYYIGLDLGYLDSTAVTVAAVHKYEPYMVYIDEFTKNEMLLDEIVKVVKSYSDKYNPSAITVDSGGFGKLTMEELKAREDFPAVVSAYKYNKKLNIEMLNNDLASKHVFIASSCRKLKEAWIKVLKTPDGKEDDKVDYGNKYVLDILDSALYLHTMCYPRLTNNIPKSRTWEEIDKERRFNKYKQRETWETRHGVKGFFDK